MDFKEMVQKAVNAETKTGLQSSIMVLNLDASCPRGHCLSVKWSTYDRKH